MAINNFNEKRRASRDFVTKAFEMPREDIKRAIDAALAYFPVKSNERTKKLEAQVLAAEREVRRSLTAVLSLHDQRNSAAYVTAQTAFDDFVAALTSGTFQAKDAEEDMATVVRVADTGAKLRGALLSLRSESLNEAVANDLISQGKQLVAGFRRSL